MTRDNPMAAGGDFAVHLAAERDAVRAFCALLDEEHDALVHGTADILPRITERKLDATRALAALVAARERAQAALGLPAGRAGLERWGIRNAVGGALIADLIALATTAHRGNSCNGTLITARLDHTSKALAVLAGGTAAIPLLYAADGQARFRAAGRSLATV